MTEDEKRTLNEIKFSKFSLGITKENTNDYLTNKFGVTPKQLATCEATIPDILGPVGCAMPNPVKTACYAKAVVELKIQYYLLKFVYWTSKIA